MRRKLIALTFFVIIAFCFHACDIAFPKEVVVKVNPELGLPINGELNEMLWEMIQNAIKGIDGADLYQYTGYKIDKNEVMTFLLQYNILQDEPLEFYDQFEDILDKFDIELDTDEMYQEIPLEQLSKISEAVEPMPIEVDLTDVLESAENSLTFDLSTAGENVHAIVPVLLGLGDLTSDEKHSFDIKMIKFETVTFVNGIFTIHLELQPESETKPLNGVDFSIGEVYIEFDDQVIEKMGGPVLFTDDIGRNDIEFDVSGKTIPDVFKIYIADIHDSSALDYSEGYPMPQAANLVIDECKVELPAELQNADPPNPMIKGVTGYVVKDGDFDFDVEENNINLAFEGDEFVHTQIRSGSIIFNIALPNDKSGDKTWITLENDFSNDIIKEIYLHQEPSFEDGQYYSGLSAKTVNSGDDTDPWPYTEVAGINGNLSGKHINKNEIKVLGIVEGVPVTQDQIISKIKIPEGKISFNLSGEDLLDKKIDLEIIPDIDITHLDVVHIRPRDIFPPMSKNIPLDEAAQSLREVHFNKLGIELQFGRVDISGLQIMVSEPNLGINPNREFKPIPLRKEGQPKTAPVAFFNETSEKILVLKDINGELIELNLEVEIKGDTTGEIMELTDVPVLEDGALVLEIESYEMYFKENWDIAILDLASMEVPMSGSFPKEGEDPMNLASMLDMLEGFTVNGIESYLYIDAPDKFFNLNPDIIMKARDGVDGKEYDLFEGDIVLKKHPIPNLNKDGDKKFSGALPDGIYVNFQEIMDDLPKDLRITYDIVFEDGIEITPEFMETVEGETEKLNVVIVVVVPMNLKAGPDGSIFELPNMFEKNKDAFGRTEQGDDGPYLGYINSLTLNVEFNDTIFKDGTLFMKRGLENDEKEEDGKELLSFDLKGKSLKIPIKGDKLEAIRNTYPYNIVEMGIRFPPSTELQIPSDLAIRRIEFDADITFGFEF